MFFLTFRSFLDKVKYMNLEEKKQNLMQLIQQKSAQYNQIDNARLGLNNEILMLQGKIDMLNELLKEETPKEDLPKA